MVVLGVNFGDILKYVVFSIQSISFNCIISDMDKDSIVGSARDFQINVSILYSPDFFGVNDV